MFRYLLSLLIFLISVFVSTSALTREDDGINEAELFRNSLPGLSSNQPNELKQSRDQLLKLTRLRPEKAIYWFNLGNAYFTLKDLKAAFQAYERVEKLGSRLSPAATLYKAKALTAQNNREGATAALKKLLASKDIPPNIRDEAKADLARLCLDNQFASIAGDSRLKALEFYRAGKYEEAIQILEATGTNDSATVLLRELALQQLNRDRLDRPSRHWLYLEPLLGYSNNIYLSPQDPIGSAFVRLDIGAGLAIHSNEKSSWTFHLSERMNETLSHGDLKALTGRIVTSIRTEESSFSWLLGAFHDHAYLANEPFESDFGAEARARWRSSRFDLSIDGSFSHPYSGLRIAPGLILDQVYSQIFVAFGRQRPGDLINLDGTRLPLDHNSLTYGLRGLWTWNSRYVLSTQLSHQKREYLEAAQPDLKSRVDNEFMISLRLTHFMGRGFQIFADGSASVNKSTLSADDSFDKSYSAATVQTGFVWDFFYE